MEVSGWGTLSSGGPSPEEMRIVTVPFVNDEGTVREIQMRQKGFLLIEV